MSITILNLPDSYKVPGFFGETDYGAGPINLRTIPFFLLLVGLKHPTLGTMTPDVDILDCTSNDDADSFAGAGSELARMAYAAIGEAKGYRLQIAAPAAAGGAAPATFTFTIGNGNTGSTGGITLYIAGKAYPVTFAQGNTPTQSAVAVLAAVNQDPKCPFLLTNVAGVITGTHKCPSVRGNDFVIYLSIAGAPSTQTYTLTGGAAVTSTTQINGVRATGGSGVETLTNILNVEFPGRYQRIVPATYDATSLGVWLTQINAKADPTVGRTEHVIVGHNGTLSAATSIAQTTLNNSRFQVCWHKDSETPPAEMAAAMGAVRAATEQPNPNSAFDGYQFATVVSQRFQSDYASVVTQQSCLDNGVTPFVSTSNGKAQVVRSITTHSLNGSVPDYRTLDTYDAWVPDWFRDDTAIFWATSFRVDNPYVQPDPGDGEPAPPPGSATPALWTAKLWHRMLGYERQNILAQVALNPPQSEYNYAANRIMSKAPTIAKPHQHQIGVKVLQGNVQPPATLP